MNVRQTTIRCALLVVYGGVSLAGQGLHALPGAGHSIGSDCCGKRLPSCSHESHAGHRHVAHACGKHRHAAATAVSTQVALSRGGGQCRATDDCTSCAICDLLSLNQAGNARIPPSEAAPLSGGVAAISPQAQACGLILPYDARGPPRAV